MILDVSLKVIADGNNRKFDWDSAWDLYGGMVNVGDKLLQVFSGLSILVFKRLIDLLE